MQPFGNVVIKILLAPDHPGESLSLDEPSVIIRKIDLELVIERVSFRAPGIDHLSEGFEWIVFGSVPQASAQLKAATRRNSANEVGGGLGPNAFGIRCGGISIHHIFVKCIFEISLHVLSEKSARVGFVFRKEPFIGFLDEELKSAHLVMDHIDRLRISRGNPRPLRIEFPRPCVAKPKLWQKVKRGLVWPAVPDRNKHVHCRRIDPRVLDEDVKVAILVEDSRIDELVFPLMLPPGAIGFDKIRIRKFRLRIFVEHFQVGVGGGGIQVVIELLAIFSVIALRIGKAKETFFEDWITPVPESEGETGAVDGDR